MATRFQSRNERGLELVVEGVAYPLKEIAGCRIAPPPDADIAVPEGSCW